MISIEKTYEEFEKQTGIKYSPPAIGSANGFGVTFSYARFLRHRYPMYYLWLWRQSEKI